MILDLKFADNGDPTLAVDEEGIDYLISGLQHLIEGDLGTRIGTPTVWSKSAPWWRFWNRSKEPKVGEFFIKRVG